ncbi:MAG: hypothetical protein ACPK7O_04730 [Methanobacterium sp.]
MNDEPSKFEKIFKRNKSAKKSEYIASIIVNIILLYIFNNILSWNISFITEALNSILWIINLSIIAAIIGNVLLLVYDPQFFRNIIKIILNIFSLYAVYALYNVFPFVFSTGYITIALQFALLITIIVLIIATIIEFLFLVLSIIKKL